MASSRVQHWAGVLLLAVALLAQLFHPQWISLLKAQADDQSYYLEKPRLSVEQIGKWQGKPFQYDSWVYSYIPKETLMGMHYVDPAHPSRLIELTGVISSDKEHFHDTKYCSFGQGYVETWLRKVNIPGTPIKAGFSKITYVDTGMVLYQLSWYQWGPDSSQATFWEWLPWVMTWHVFHSQTPQWHYFNLTFRDSQASVTEAEALPQLLDFAQSLQEQLRSASSH